MNFFEHQARARRRARWLLLLFALAVLVIILVVDLVVLLAFGQVRTDPQSQLPAALPAPADNLPLLLWTALATAAAIGLASLYRILRLRQGGGAVAQGLGGVLVSPETSDPLHRRLRNLVEEMAIAAGVPVPEVYVLDREAGINAFAAGYAPADAAIAVTRGALQHLTRAELQGVIAHEFSHILNGDMRLNVHLIGLLFGILVLALVGRVLLSVRYGRSGRATIALVGLGLALVMIGSIGVLFGRLIQASVGRQREYLADASAVQFTREPTGIGGALKKIAALGSGSVLSANSEEVGHMLFAAGFKQRFLATHPPLVERIRAIEPRFDPGELVALRATLARERMVPEVRDLVDLNAPVALEPAGVAAASGRVAPAPARLALDADRISAGIGRPQPAQMAAAARSVERLPPLLARAARSDEWVIEAVCSLLIDTDADIRDRQLLLVAQSLGLDSERRLNHLLAALPALDPTLRLPLLEIAFPTLRRRPVADLQALLGLVERLIHCDGRVEVFEYVLARLLAEHLRDALHPGTRAGPGSARLSARRPAAQDLLMLLAIHGNPGDPGAASAALRAGLVVLGLESAPTPALSAADWPRRLDQALAQLAALRPADQDRLVRALIATVSHAGVQHAETELLRAISAALRVPIPIPA